MSSRTVPPERGIFCNRTLNLRSIKAIGYDMDYTLVHYHVDEWERRAYEHSRAAAGAARLAGRRPPVRPRARDPRARHRHRARQPRQGQPLRLREEGDARHAAARVRGAARAVRAHDRRSRRAALGLPQHALLALRGVPVRAARRPARRAASSPRCSATPTSTARSARTSTRRTWRASSRRRSSPTRERFVVLDPETPLALLDQKHAGQEAAAHHQLRVELHRSR